ncbi:MAG: universal stress protein [Bacteroidetes bacterium]|nr:universal stress protein [Bacteroidota bacterium]
MKNILLLTDFSDNAYNALLYTTQLFKSSPCKFYLIHSFEGEMSLLTSRVDIGKSEQVYDQLFESAESKLMECKRSIERDSEPYGHSYEIIASSRPLPKEVNYLIKKMTANFVVLGTKGVTAATEVLLGSNAVKVIKKIKGCPLLIIPERINFQPVQKMAFATGFQNEVAPSEWEVIKSLMTMTKSHLHILNVQRDQEELSASQHENRHNLKNLLLEASADILRLQKKETKTETILEFIASENVDFLIMIFYKHGFLKSLFRESVIKKIGRQAQIPYLMIPART